MQEIGVKEGGRFAQRGVFSGAYGATIRKQTLNIGKVPIGHHS